MFGTCRAEIFDRIDRSYMAWTSLARQAFNQIPGMSAVAALMPILRPELIPIAVAPHEEMVVPHLPAPDQLVSLVRITRPLRDALSTRSSSDICGKYSTSHPSRRSQVASFPSMTSAMNRISVGIPQYPWDRRPAKLSILPRRGSRSGIQPDHPRFPDAPLDFKACSEHESDYVKVGDKVVCHLRCGEGGGFFGEGEE